MLSEKNKNQSKNGSSENLFNSLIGFFSAFFSCSILSLSLLFSFFLKWGFKQTEFLQTNAGSLIIVFGLILALLMGKAGQLGGMTRDIASLLFFLLWQINLVVFLFLFRPDFSIILWIFFSIVTFVLLNISFLMTHYCYIPSRTYISYLFPIWFFLICSDALFLSLISIEVWVMTVIVGAITLILVNLSEQVEYSRFMKYLQLKMQCGDRDIYFHELVNISTERFLRPCYLKNNIMKLNKEFSVNYHILIGEDGLPYLSIQEKLISKRKNQSINQQTSIKKRLKGVFSKINREDVLTVCGIGSLMIIMLLVFILISVSLISNEALNDPRRLIFYFHFFYMFLVVEVSGLFTMIFAITMRKKGFNG